jgi:murein DD-endopeptidase MepM/ murein hydrolase activator NlpD
LKERDDYVITISRTGELRGHSIRLSLGSVITCFILILASFTLLILLGVHYHKLWLKSVDYARLEQEIDELNKGQEGIKLSAKQLADQINSLQVTAQKLKVLSGIDEDALGGVGGPRKPADPVLSLSQRDLSKHFRSLDRKRITLHTELRQLQDYYTTREILRAATPSLMPVRGYPSDRFGRRTDPLDGMESFHPGIDISAPRGAKVVATADGLVVFARRRAGYGKLVTIEHKFGISTRYGHLDRFSVEAGQRVKKGDIIGYVGSTGRSTGPHLHYEVLLRSQPLNPLRFFRASL